MRAEHDETDHLSRHALVQQVAYGEEVTKRFGHFLALDLQHLVMQPVARHLVGAIGAAALGDLVLVVGELQIQTAAVDVKDVRCALRLVRQTVLTQGLFPQQLVRHGGAFDVPAGAATAPGAVPPRRRIVRRLPQHEIHRVTLVWRNLDPRTGDHIVDRPARQRAIGFVAFDREQHMSLGGIGVSLGDQIFDHRDHLRNIGGGAWHVVGLKRADFGHIVQKPLGCLGGDLSDRPSALCCARVDLVIHIREVAHIGHMGVAIDMTQQPVEHVKHDHGARIAQMGAVVHRGPTDIHPHVFIINRGEILAFAGFRVVQLDRGHGASLRKDCAGMAQKSREENDVSKPAGRS